jgi:putative membrane protein
MIRLHNREIAMPVFREAVIAAVLTVGLASSAPALAQPPMSPEAFAAAAAQSDQYEIQSGRVVATESNTPRVKAFAQEMIDAHMKTSGELKSAAVASGLPPPPETVGADQQRMLGALQSAKGPELDRAYAVQQVNAHTSALVTQKAYAEGGSDPNLRKTAQAAVPLISHHLDMAKELAGALGQ